LKRLTREQVESRKEKAARFVENVLGDSERADEIADEDVDSYAERRGIEITNPSKRRKIVAKTKSKAELEQENQELQDEIDELNDRLDAIADLTSDEDEEDDEEDEDDTDPEN
jgi:hypothetical protein